MTQPRQITCISCPIGCQLQVFLENDTINVTGNQCARGAKYGVAEYTNPVRMVTSIMRVAGGGQPVPVRLSDVVPKTAIPQVLEAIAVCEAPSGVKRYDVLIKDVAQTGVDVIATAGREA